MKNIIFTFIILMSLTTFGQNSFNYHTDFNEILQKTKDKKSNLNYENLLNRFSINDTTLSNYEVLALLIGYTDKPDYKPYNDISIENEIYDLNGDKKYKEGLDSGIKFLKTHPFGIKTLFEVSFSYYKLGNRDSSDFYLYKGRKIFEAMYFSGNGFTSDTPTFALGPADGQIYIRKFIGEEIGTMGSGRDKNGDFLDILDIKFEGEEETVKLYFIIQHAVAKMFLKD